MGIFSKKPEETYLEYRDRAINSISPSFCGAKWYNATIWLGNGTTASCHHPPAHKIPLEEVAMSYQTGYTNPLFTQRRSLANVNLCMDGKKMLI